MTGLLGLQGLRTLALVESPAQLVNVVEWAAATGETDDLRIAVLAPKDPTTRAQLELVADLARADGLDVGMVDVRALGSGGLLGGVRLTRSLAVARRVVIGDPFSGLIQTLLPVVRAPQVVVVDDGTATWQFAACIDAGAPLVRWRLDQADAAARAARATRLLSPSSDRTLTVFSCLDGATPAGALGVVNRYAWTRSRWVPQVRRGAVDVLGASLVETGVVDRRAYLDAVRRLTGPMATVRYLPHRREDAGRLEEIAALPGVEVERNDLPVELSLRRGPVAERVVTFPSTAAYTLPVVLRGTGVTIEVRRVEDAWFTASTSDRARAFVERIGADAPVPELQPAP